MPETNNNYEVDATLLYEHQSKPRKLSEVEKEVIKEPSIIKEPMQVALHSTITYKETYSPNSKDDAFSRQRDFLYYMPIVVRQLFADLITDRCPKDVKEIQSTKEFKDCLKCYNAYVDMINLFTGEDAKQTIDEAAVAAGYDKQPAELKLALEAAVGRLFTAGYFFGARVMAPLGKHPPEWIGYTDGTFEQMAREANMAIDGTETPYARSVKEHVQKVVGNR